VCSHVEHSKGNSVPITELLGEIRGLYQDFNEQGFRTLGLAYRDRGRISQIGEDHEEKMVFLGLLVFSDPNQSRHGGYDSILEATGGLAQGPHGGSPVGCGPCREASRHRPWAVADGTRSSPIDGRRSP